MGRELKRVPMEFDWPLGEVWNGYVCTDDDLIDCPVCKGVNSDDCMECYGGGKVCPPEVDPPVGDGFQMWENTSEGSPQSPVFATLEELCTWLELNANIFANDKVSKEYWFKQLNSGAVKYESGGIAII